jgi:hypothetical protein
MGEACGTNGAEEKCIQIWMRKTEEKKKRGRPRRRWGIVIKYIYNIKWHNVVWINLAWDWDNWRAVVSTVMNLQDL